MEKQETVQGSYSSPLPAEKLLSLDSKNSGGDNFMVDDLFDFSNDDLVVATDAAIDSVTGNSTDSSTVTVVDSCNSSTFSGYDPNFSGDIACRNVADSNISGDLCVPCDDLAELEWLSNFVEESFSCDDLQKLQLISGVKGRHDESSETHQFQSELNQNNSSSNNDNNNNENAANNSPVFQPEIPVPAKARSKRSRAAPCNWASRLLVLSPTSSSSSETEIVATGPPPPPVPQTTGKKTVKACTPKKRDGGGDGSDGNGEGRRCLHCATDKTPQWRTGPMGPKTLCNACGVRFKSGRLVPEYRPASSPTFVLTKHSNSHRKVLELRRQKEMVRMQQQQQHQFIHHHHHQNMMFDVSNGEDFLIHQHVGPDFRQLI